MPNMSNEKVRMPEQDPSIRNKNFDEVALGYTDKMALQEASRCLGCKNRPCVSGCPVGVPIPDFIEKIVEGDVESAYEKIISMNTLPAICGRVCPQEKQCEAKCVRGKKGESVAIGRLERYVADWFISNSKRKKEKIFLNGHKVAVVGSGPSGLVCAGELARRGYSVTIFEALHEAGGVLMYGIPEFRLPKKIVKEEIDNLRDMGVKIQTDAVIGRTLSVEEIFDLDFEAVYIGSGAGLPRFMNIEGEDLNGVYSANEFLTRINLMKAYKKEYDTPILNPKKVVVVGGGNVAMDAARCAKRIDDADVTVVYRRSLDEMPARTEEIEHAKSEGINFELLCSPDAIIGDANGYVKGLECVKMKLGEIDESGRRSFNVVENSNFAIEADCVIIAIGNSPNPLISSTTAGLKVDNRGCLVVDESTFLTTRKNVYAGGDAVTGAATVILAMGAGKRAANAIDESLTSRR